MTRYRHRPIEITALQWNPDSMIDAGRIVGTLLGEGVNFRHPDGMGATTTLLIDTPEGEQTALPGDWIVRVAGGDWAVMAAADFAERYAPAAVSVPPPAPRADDRAAVLREAADRLSRKASVLTEGLDDFAIFVGKARAAEAEILEREAEELRRMADEAQQPASGPCVAGEQQNETPEAEADRDGAAATVHAVPLPGSNGISSCCGRPPCEFVGERVTRDPDKVTCTGPAAGVRQDGAQP